MGVVHIEIDQTQPLVWSNALRAQTVGAALAFVKPYQSVQIDMEARESQHGAVLEVLRGMCAGLAPGTTLSMTALASWCDTEHWLTAAPVDEIVPMLDAKASNRAGRLNDAADGTASEGEIVLERCLGDG